jgi:dUTP pyrophosphatase
MTSPVVKFQRLPRARGLQLPQYQSELAAGVDLQAANFMPITLLPNEVVTVPCGFNIAIPEGFEGQVRSRSGLARKNSVCVLNSPGTIDADYRGEPSAILINHGEHPFIVNRGDRIAQLVISPVVKAVILEVEELDETARGTGGFGSTGVAG